MKVNLIINAPAFSINKMYYNKPSTKVRSQEARQWSNIVFNELNRAYNQHQLRKFRNNFDETTMGVEIKITQFYPLTQFFTKDFKISGRTFDISNVEKPLIDLIYLPKYFIRTPPEGCNNVNVDDRFNVKMVSEKRPSPKYEPFLFVEVESFLNSEKYDWAFKDLSDLI